MATLNEKTLLPIGAVIGGIAMLVPALFALGAKNARDDAVAAKVAALEVDQKDDRKAVFAELQKLGTNVHELQWSVERLREAVDKPKR